jgi:hypothetical protein
MAGEIAEFLRQMGERSGSTKSTVLKSLGWLLFLLLTATVSASKFSAQPWLVIALAAMTGLTVLVYLGAYIYFALTDSDALRSEKFTLQKIGLEHGYIGDDLTGWTRIKKATVADALEIEDAKIDTEVKEEK